MSIGTPSQLLAAQLAYDSMAEPEPRTDDDIESEANAMADSILRAASRAVAGINEPRERLARQVGILQGENRSLCSQLVWAREGV